MALFYHICCAGKVSVCKTGGRRGNATPPATHILARTTSASPKTIWFDPWTSCVRWKERISPLPAPPPSSEIAPATGRGAFWGKPRRRNGSLSGHQRYRRSIISRAAPPLFLRREPSGKVLYLLVKPCPGWLAKAGQGIFLRAESTERISARPANRRPDATETNPGAISRAGRERLRLADCSRLIAPATRRAIPQYYAAAWRRGPHSLTAIGRRRGWKPAIAC
jgi:hypothetical protein